MNRNTGGAAFPAGTVKKKRPIHDPGADFHVTEIIEPKNQGMMLRDYFAAKAMQSLVHSTQTMMHVTPAMVAEEAYVYADALLAARGR